MLETAAGWGKTRRLARRQQTRAGDGGSQGSETAAQTTSRLPPPPRLPPPARLLPPPLLPPPARLPPPPRLPPSVLLQPPALLPPPPRLQLGWLAGGLVGALLAPARVSSAPADGPRSNTGRLPCVSKRAAG